MPELKRNIKDSVFTALFGNPENVAQLYWSLHPEDTQVSAADCKIVTLETILASGVYNNLRLLVRGKLIVLVEARSAFSPNIVLQMLMCLVATYTEYVRGIKSPFSPASPQLFPVRSCMQFTQAEIQTSPTSCVLRIYTAKTAALRWRRLC